jgi:hypothetical protein
MFIRCEDCGDVRMADGLAERIANPDFCKRCFEILEAIEATGEED